jgi:hypothetical protein
LAIKIIAPNDGTFRPGPGAVLVKRVGGEEDVYAYKSLQVNLLYSCKSSCCPSTKVQILTPEAAVGESLARDCSVHLLYWCKGTNTDAEGTAVREGLAADRSSWAAAHGS